MHMVVAARFLYSAALRLVQWTDSELAVQTSKSEIWIQVERAVCKSSALGTGAAGDPHPYGTCPLHGPNAHPSTPHCRAYPESS
jgi:hypothetical protein